MSGKHHKSRIPQTHHYQLWDWLPDEVVTRDGRIFLAFIALRTGRLLSTGHADLEKIRTPRGTPAKVAVAQLELNGFVTVRPKTELSDFHLIELTDKGWAEVGGKPFWMEKHDV